LLCFLLCRSYFLPILGGLDFIGLYAKLQRLPAIERSLKRCIAFVASHHFGRAGSPSASLSDPHVFLLGVDELTKCYVQSGSFSTDVISASINAVLTAVGSLMDSYTNLLDGRRLIILPVVTSLSQVIMGPYTHASQRPITWIPLPPLVSAADQMLLTLDIKKTTHPLAAKAVSMLCDYVGGHGRMLQALAAILIRRRETLLNSELRCLNDMASLLISDELLQAYLASWPCSNFCVLK